MFKQEFISFISVNLFKRSNQANLKNRKLLAFVMAK